MVLCILRVMVSSVVGSVLVHIKTPPDKVDEDGFLKIPEQLEL